jgi:hypothetical protein
MEPEINRRRTQTNAGRSGPNLQNLRHLRLKNDETRMSNAWTSLGRYLLFGVTKITQDA